VIRAGTNVDECRMDESAEDYARRFGARVAESSSEDEASSAGPDVGALLRADLESMRNEQGADLGLPSLGLPSLGLPSLGLCTLPRFEADPSIATCDAAHGSVPRDAVPRDAVPRDAVPRDADALLGRAAGLNGRQAAAQEDDRPPLRVEWASPTQGDERASERLGPSQDSAIDVFCASICAVS
jgi:hypothetical protein